MIKISDLSFSYIKDKAILKNISFDIPDGKCVILLGPNGVGKSTIIKCILGNLKIQQGNISFDGKNIKELSAKEKSSLVAFVPQLIKGNDLTVKETITLGRLPYFRIYPNQKDNEEVNRVIKQFHLEEIEDRQTNEISGGERQKVAIARALVQGAKTILFDEPTSNLDIKAQLEVVDVLKQIIQTGDNSLLISMHDINLALSLGDLFVFLKDESIYQICTKEEITEEILSEVYQTNIKLIEKNRRKIVIYENIR